MEKDKQLLLELQMIVDSIESISQRLSILTKLTLQVTDRLVALESKVEKHMGDNRHISEEDLIKMELHHNFQYHQGGLSKVPAESSTSKETCTNER